MKAKRGYPPRKKKEQQQNGEEKRERFAEKGEAWGNDLHAAQTMQKEKKKDRPSRKMSRERSSKKRGKENAPEKKSQTERGTIETRTRKKKRKRSRPFTREGRGPWRSEKRRTPPKTEFFCKGKQKEAKKAPQYPTGTENHEV